MGFRGVDHEDGYCMIGKLRNENVVSVRGRVDGWSDSSQSDCMHAPRWS